MNKEEFTSAGWLSPEEAAKLKSEIDALHRERIGEVWYWQGDGEDHLESLTCPILIGADDLREIVRVAAEDHEIAEKWRDYQKYEANGVPSFGSGE